MQRAGVLLLIPLGFQLNGGFDDCYPIADPGQEGDGEA